MTNSIKLFYIYIIAIITVILFAHIVEAFAHNMSFLSVIMLIVSITGLYLSLNNSLTNNKNENIIAKYSYVTISSIYFIIIFISLIIVEFIKIDIQSLCLYHLVLFSIYIIIIITLSISNNYINKSNSRTKELKRSWKMLILDIEIMQNNLIKSLEYKHEKVLDDFKLLMDKIKYSDPISNNEILDIDEKIFSNIDSLQYEITKKNYNEIQNKINLLLEIIDLRNKKLKISKE